MKRMKCAQTAVIMPFIEAGASEKANSRPVMERRISPHEMRKY